MMLQHAEANRDSKRNRKPFQLDQFCLYGDQEKERAPAAKYGAAANALITAGLFPAWALFIYSDLRKNAQNATAPEPAAFVSDFAVLLSPSCSDGQCIGMLVASKEASGQVVDFESPCGKQIRLLVPFFQASTYAEEDLVMRIAR